MGWGKLSSGLFKEKSGNYELGIKLASFLGIMVVNQFGRKKGCAQCKMRYICKASAAK